MVHDPADPEDLAAVRELLHARATKHASAGKSHAIWLLLISVLLFVMQQHLIAGSTGLWIAALILVLLVHEAGHALAMRVFGYRDLRMFFIPFFGAAASGVKHDANAVQRAVVALMGPLPGIVFALIALQLAPFDSQLLVNIVVLSIYLNAFNLLPFGGLDGGRYLDTTLFARWPIMRQLVGHLGGLALAWIGWQLEAWLLLAWGVWTFVIAINARAIGLARARLREQLEPGEAPPEPFPDRLIPAAMQLANELAFSKIQTTPAHYAGFIGEVWSEIGERPPALGPTLLLLGAYGVALALVVVAFVQLGVL